MRGTRGLSRPASAAGQSVHGLVSRPPAISRYSSSWEMVVSIVTPKHTDTVRYGGNVSAAGSVFRILSLLCTAGGPLRSVVVPPCSFWPIRNHANRVRAAATYVCVSGGILFWEGTTTLQDQRLTDYVYRFAYTRPAIIYTIFTFRNSDTKNIKKYRKRPEFAIRGAFVLYFFS